MQQNQKNRAQLRRWRSWRGAGFLTAGLALLLFGGCVEGRGAPEDAAYYRASEMHTAQRGMLRAEQSALAMGSAAPQPQAEQMGLAVSPDNPPPMTAAMQAANRAAEQRERVNREYWRDEDCLRGDSTRARAAVNPWTPALEDPKSTFGLDVDTASFAIARSYLRRGELPPAETVRTEEIVNAFTYADPGTDAPGADNATFTVHAEMAPTPFAPKSYLLRIGLKARPVSRAARLPVRLTFVVDVSGSMGRENRLVLVRQALHDLVDRLKPDDQVAIVIFSDQAEVWLNSTPVREKATIQHVIDNLAVGGATSIEEGLALGYRVAARNLQPDHTNRVILCSDGEANVGTTDPEQLLTQIDRFRQQGLYLSTVGFGLKNYNDATLETLADHGDGNYDHIDRIEESDRVFGDKLTSMLEVVAKDAKIQVEFNPDRVAAYRLLGYENRQIADPDFRNDRVDAGEVGAGHAVTALYEVTLRNEPLAAGQAPVSGRAAIDAAVDALVPAPPTGAPGAVAATGATGAGTEKPAAPPARALTAEELSRLAVVRLRYKVPVKPPAADLDEIMAGARGTPPVSYQRERVATAQFTVTDAAIVTQLSRASADLRLGLAAAQFSELLRGSPFAAQADIDSVLAILRSVAEDRGEDLQVEELYDMALRWKQLTGVTRVSEK